MFSVYPSNIYIPFKKETTLSKLLFMDGDGDEIFIFHQPMSFLKAGTISYSHLLPKNLLGLVITHRQWMNVKIEKREGKKERRSNPSNINIFF